MMCEKAALRHLTADEREILPRALYESRYLSAGSNHQLIRSDIPYLLAALNQTRGLLTEVVNAKPSRLKAVMFAIDSYFEDIS